MPAWTPAFLGSGLKVWLKADAITGLADGGVVASWLDSSGNSNPAINVSGTDQPTYQTNEINSLPVVRFDGTDDDMVVASLTLTQPFTMAWLGKIIEDTSGYFWASSGISARLAATDDILVNAGSSQTFTEPDHTDDAAHILTVTHSGASSFITWDGTVSSAKDIGTGGSSGNLTLGRSASTYLISDWAEFVVIQGTLATDDRRRITGYLAHKWGIAANLPGDHPYKSAAPVIPQSGFSGVIG